MWRSYFSNSKKIMNHVTLRILHLPNSVNIFPWLAKLWIFMCFVALLNPDSSAFIFSSSSFQAKIFYFLLSNSLIFILFSSLKMPNTFLSISNNPNKTFSADFKSLSISFLFSDPIKSCLIHFFKSRYELKESQFIWVWIKTDPLFFNQIPMLCIFQPQKVKFKWARQFIILSIYLQNNFTMIEETHNDHPRFASTYLIHNTFWD